MMNPIETVTDTSVDLGDFATTYCLLPWPADIVGVVASFLPSADLRTTFVCVCKQWREVGMHIVNGMPYFISQLRDVRILSEFR